MNLFLDRSSSVIILSLVFLLMLLNWSLETVKWRYLIGKIEKISFINSFMAVWAGLTAGSFTPNRTGEFFTRAFILEKANRWEGIFITFMGSISQLIPTMIFGTTAAFLFIVSLNPGQYSDRILMYCLLLGVLLLVTIFLVIMYFRLPWLMRFFKKIIPHKYERFRIHMDVYNKYSFRELFNALVLSSIRYLVFTIQYCLLIKLCNIEIPFLHALMVVSLIFLVTTAIPTFALTELGVRGSVSIVLMEMYFNNRSIMTDISANAFLASSMIWIINLIIPAIIGGFFVFRLKFFRR